jgi:hypothetical protein
MKVLKVALDAEPKRLMGYREPDGTCLGRPVRASGWEWNLASLLCLREEWRTVCWNQR